MAIEAIINEVRKLDGDLDELDRRLVALETAIFGCSGQMDEVWEGSGWLLGRKGSNIHILDPLTKRPISSGFSQIILADSGYHSAYSGLVSKVIFTDPAFRLGDQTSS